VGRALKLDRVSKRPAVVVRATSGTKLSGHNREHRELILVAFRLIAGSNTAMAYLRMPISCV
jgi:hypothetical protein